MDNDYEKHFATLGICCSQLKHYKKMFYDVEVPYNKIGALKKLLDYHYEKGRSDVLRDIATKNVTKANG